jgi:hypothetical protein
MDMSKSGGDTTSSLAMSNSIEKSTYKELKKVAGISIDETTTISSSKTSSPNNYSSLKNTLAPGNRKNDDSAGLGKHKQHNRKFTKGGEDTSSSYCELYIEEKDEEYDIEDDHNP